MFGARVTINTCAMRRPAETRRCSTGPHASPLTLARTSPLICVRYFLRCTAMQQVHQGQLIHAGASEQVVC